MVERKESCMTKKFEQKNKIDEERKKIEFQHAMKRLVLLIGPELFKDFQEHPTENHLFYTWLVLKGGMSKYL
jgi:hypothetical protein